MLLKKVDATMRKNPYTFTDFFNAVWKEVKPYIDDEFIDYAIPASETVYGKQLLEDPAELRAELEYGPDEGIYLRIATKGGRHMGTVKSLDNSKEAFVMMGEIFGRFVGEAQEIYWDESYNFDFKYVLARMYNESGRSVVGTYHPSFEQAEQFAREKMETGKYAKARIFDLIERQEYELTA
jgi:hypothetical protein